MIYAKKFGYVLDSENASDILALKSDDRNRAMKALALLSKFQGRYDEWKAIRSRYDLKWASESSFEVFNRIANNREPSFSDMLTWVKSTVQVLPPEYGNIILFTTMTGLRANESLAAIKLIKTDLDHYKNSGMLEHFRYPDLFIRRTKKAFISIATDRIVNLAKSSQNVNYEGFRTYLKRRNLESNLKYCRKLFATYLRMNHIEPEIIDLLEGRISKSVFLRHYYRPNFKEELQKIRVILTGLAKEIECKSKKI